ncbi:MAG TPA: SCO family protein [Gammaproteobacteria bacterium]|nr:SCO family protein [Gammaproteobacteria bacterium]
MKFKNWPYTGLFLLAVAGGLLAGYLSFHARHRERPVTAALLLHDPKPLPDFSLADTTGGTFTKASLVGHWNLLYFGYTHCPDACPTTLAALDKFTAQTGRLPKQLKPRVYFVSVDPKRDSLELLKNYALYFNPAFTGATGSLDALHALTTPLGVDFSYGKPDAKGDYAVDHTSFVVLVDPRAEEVALFSPPMEPARMAADYRAILKFYGDSP